MELFSHARNFSCEENSVVLESDYEYDSYKLLFVRWGLI